MVLCVLTVQLLCYHVLSVLVPNPMAGQSASSGCLHYMSQFKCAYGSMMVNAFKDHAAINGMPNSEIPHAYNIHGVNRGLGIGVLWG